MAWDPEYQGQRWQNMPTEVPPSPSDYKGWDKMRCQYNAVNRQILPNPYAD